MELAPDLSYERQSAFVGGWAFNHTHTIKWNSFILSVDRQPFSKSPDDDLHIVKIIEKYGDHVILRGDEDLDKIQYAPPPNQNFILHFSDGYGNALRNGLGVNTGGYKLLNVVTMLPNDWFIMYTLLCLFKALPYECVCNLDRNLFSAD